MRDETIYKGKWWLPTNPRKKIAGTLDISNSEKIRLELDGEFFKEQNPEDIFQPIILGRTNHGDVTLYRNYLQGSSGRIEGYTNTSYESQHLLTDGHYSNLETKHFKQITLSYPNLFNWLSQRKYDFVHLADVLKIDNPAPYEFNFRVDEDLEIQFTIYISSGGHFLSPINISIQESAIITFNFIEKKTFEELLAIENRFRNFLRFAIAGQTYLESLYIESPLKTKKRFYPPHQVIQLYKSAQKIEKISSFDMLFTYARVQNQINDIFVNWFSKYEELLPIYNLYFNAFYSDITVLDQSFLNAIQALEAYHRRTKNNSVLPKAEHKQKIEAIVNAVPEEYKDWVAAKLAFSNEPILTERINDILSDFDEVNIVFIADPEFSKKVKDYRNLFTHYDPKKTKEPIDSNDLYKQWNKLRVLLDCCLLKELGLSTELITTLIREKYIHLFNYLNRRD